jgi:hypothetical protein
MYMYKNVHRYNMFFFPVSPSFYFSPFVLIYCIRFVHPMLSVSLDFQFLLSTSVFSYVYFASVADTFLFYWINVCFGDSM